VNGSHILHLGVCVAIWRVLVKPTKTPLFDQRVASVQGKLVK